MSILRLAIARRNIPSAVLAAAAATAALATFTPTADATVNVSFCGVTYNSGVYCSREASFSLDYISADPDSSRGCVYRGTNNSTGAPSASGSEYCSGASGGHVEQAFHGNYGNPTVHNRGSRQYIGAAYGRT